MAPERDPADRDQGADHSRQRSDSSGSVTPVSTAGKQIKVGNGPDAVAIAAQPRQPATADTAPMINATTPRIERSADSLGAARVAGGRYQTRHATPPAISGCPWLMPGHRAFRPQEARTAPRALRVLGTLLLITIVHVGMLVTSR
jgi:hypothetical protein